MKQTIKLVLTVIALWVCALPVQAEEKVYYCETTGVAKTTMDKAETYGTEKFKVKVSSQEIVFGKGGFFNGSVMPINWWSSVDMWNARDDSSRVSFKDGEFHYAQTAYHLALAISARCDDF